MLIRRVTRAPSFPKVVAGVVAAVVLVAGAVLPGLTFPLCAFEAGAIVVEEGLTYGKAGDIELKLDLARPSKGDGPFPAVVFIHGGAWAGGNREVYRSTIESGARRGYVAVTISYRLTQPDLETKTGKVPFPAQIQDCKCAVRWLRSAADKYHIDADRIGVTGGSAGGHLSLLVGLTDEKAGLEGDGGHADQSSRVQAVVNYCGPTELSQEYRDVKAVQPYLQALCGGTPESAADSYKTASPVTYISKDDPPVLTFHGDKDDIVPVAQAKLLDEAMKMAGARHELMIFEGQGHALQGNAGKAAEQVLWLFFDARLKAR